jgi:MFS family permease
MTETEALPPEAAQSLWRNGDFLKFWSGETLSLFGTQVTTLALPLTAVLVFGAGPEALGLLRFVQLVPYLFFALVFGVWVERCRRRPVMLGANAARMVLIGLVPVLAALHALNLPLLLAFAFGIGIAGVLFDVSWLSYVPTLVRHKRYLVEANSKLAVTSTASDTAGPGVAGVLISALTAPVAMAVDAGSYLVSMVSLALIRTPEKRPDPPAQKRRLLPELLDGLRWVFGNRYLRAVALVGGFCNFFLMANSSLFVIYAVRDKGLSPTLLGITFSIGAFGGLVGALVSNAIVRRLRLGLVYAVSVSSIFLSLLLIPSAQGPKAVLEVTFIASLFIGYFGVAVSNVVIVSMRQTLTPSTLMARMTAAMRTLMYGGGSLGGLAATLLGGAFGTHTALWVIAVGAALTVIPILLSPVARLHTMPTPARD